MMTRGRQPIRRHPWVVGRARYWAFVLSLLPAWEPPRLQDEPPTVGDELDDYRSEELNLVIDEGRRRADELLGSLRDVRNRAQVTFSTALLVLAALAGRAGPLDWRPPSLEDVFLTIGFVTTAYAALGSAALFAVKAQVGSIDLERLTSKPQEEVSRSLAIEYVATNVHTSTTVRTRLTLFFEAVVWLLIGSACFVIATIVG